MKTISHSNPYACRSGGGSKPFSRRDFLSRAAWGAGAGLALFAGGRALAQTPAPPKEPVRVALTHGESHAQNIYQALKLIEPQIRAGLAGKKRIIVKPNMVCIDKPLSAIQAECIEGLLEFLSPLTQEEIVVTESPANGPAAEGFDNYGYYRLEKKFPVKFLDLDAQPFETLHVVNEKHRPVPVRFSSFLRDPEAFIISAAPMKAHDRAVVTLGLKNLTVGAILKDRGFRWRADSVGVNDKPWVHGGPRNEGIHYNLFSLAKILHPDLTILDGYRGMEHNGPNDGDPVEHRIAVASTDWLAADRAAVELMGFDFAKVGYLGFCAQAGMGEADLSKLEVLGERIADHKRPYRPHDNIEEQYKWLEEPKA